MSRFSSGAAAGRHDGRGRGHASGSHFASRKAPIATNGTSALAERMVDDVTHFFRDLVPCASRPKRAPNTPAAAAKQPSYDNAHSSSSVTENKSAQPIRHGKGHALSALPGESLGAHNREPGSHQVQHSISWVQLGLCKALVRAVTHMNFITPTPVQAAAIPYALHGRDVCARAVTGSGKTAAFLLPLLNHLLTHPPMYAHMSKSGGGGKGMGRYIHSAYRNHARVGVNNDNNRNNDNQDYDACGDVGRQSANADLSGRRRIRSLVLVPTRELGAQCESMLRPLMRFTTTPLQVTLAIGGVAPQAQEAALSAAPDIVLATPGRLVDLLYNLNTNKYTSAATGRGALLNYYQSASPVSSKTVSSAQQSARRIDLTGVEFLVLDECDKMLTATLRDQVVDVVQRIPVETRQVLLFSATMTEEVDSFAQEHLYKPRNVDVGHVALQARLRQQFVRIAGTAGVVSSSSNHNHHDHRTTSSDGADRASAHNSSKADGRNNATRDSRLVNECHTNDSDNNNRSNSNSNTLDEKSSPVMNEEEHSSIIKTRYLIALCMHYLVSGRTIVFCHYRTTVHRLALLMNALQLPTCEVQGSQSQDERFAALEDFASGRVRFLVTTDVAARGWDVAHVTTVVNYDLPPTLTAYIHRVGRTARIGAEGTAVSLVEDARDGAVMRKILALSGGHAAGKRDRQAGNALHEVGATRGAEHGEKGHEGTSSASHATADGKIDSECNTTRDDDDNDTMGNANSAGMKSRSATDSVTDDADATHSRVRAKEEDEDNMAGQRMMQHTVASVRRRDIPVEVLQRAAAAIDAVFDRVRAQLAAEQLVAQVTQAERRLSASASRARDRSAVEDNNHKESSHSIGHNRLPHALEQHIIAEPQRRWCLSPAEQQRRGDESRRAYEREVEATRNHFQNELASLHKEESRLCQQQRQSRRVGRERAALAQEKVREQRRAERAKEQSRLQAGVVKKLKQKKIREGARERREGARLAKSGGGGAKERRRYNARGKKTSAKKSRHRGTVKKH